MFLEGYVLLHCGFRDLCKGVKVWRRESISLGSNGKKNCLEKEKGGLGVKDVAMFMELLAK